MEATLEAVKRDGPGQERGATPPRGGQDSRRSSTARARRGEAPEGVPGRGRPEGAAAHPALGLRRQHADQPEAWTAPSRAVMVKEYQLDPVTHALLHADFYQLAMDKAITVTVPIVLKGEPTGVKLQGGLLDFVTRDIQVQCLPADIPEHIDIDVTELMLHQSIRVRDLPQNPKWKAVTDGETMLVHVVLPKAEEAAATARGGRGAAPARRPSPRSSRRARRTKEGREGRRSRRRSIAGP